MATVDGLLFALKLVSALGCGLIWLRSEWVAAPRLDRPQMAEITGRIERVETLAAKGERSLLAEAGERALHLDGPQSPPALPATPGRFVAGHDLLEGEGGGCRGWARAFPDGGRSRSRSRFNRGRRRSCLGARRLHLHQQREPASRFERDHAPGVDHVAHAQCGGMAPRAAKAGARISGADDHRLERIRR